MLGLMQKWRRSRLTTDILMLYILQLVNIILPLVTIPYFMRVLTPEGFGLAATTQSFAAYFNVILEYGFFLTATREVAVVKDNRDALSNVVAGVVWTKLIMLLTCTLVFPVIVFSVPSLRVHYFEYLLAFGLVLANTSIPGWLFQGVGRLPELTLVTLIIKIAQLPIMIFLVKSRSDVWIWLLISLISSLLIVFVAWTRAVPTLVGIPKWPGWQIVKNQIHSGFAIFLSQAAVSFYTVGNSFLLSQFTGLKEAGYYSVVEKIVRGASALLSPLQQAVFSKVNQMAIQDRMQSLAFTKRFLVMTGAFALILSVVLGISSDSIQYLISGTEFSKTGLILKYMAILPFLFALGSTLTLQIMIPFRLDSGLVFVYFAAGIANISISVILMPKVGAVGMAISVIVAEVIVVGSQIFIASRNNLNLFSKNSR